MGFLRRSGICTLAFLAGSAALQFEPAIIRDVAFGHGSEQVTVGAVRVPLWSAAFAQSTDSFTLEDVRFTWGPFTYEAKRIDFTDTKASRRNFETLFSSTTEPMAERVARISAREVTAPEVKVTQKLGNRTQTVLYRNVSLNDIVQGQIGSVTIDTMAIEDTSAKGNILTSYGRTKISDLDMPAFMRLYDTKDGKAALPLTRIYGSLSMEDIDVLDTGEDYSLEIERVNGRNIMARPTRDSWSGTIALISELTDKSTTTSEEKDRLVMAVADLLEAFDTGFVETTGIKFKSGPK
ncbi:hypothetical protein [Microvirga roseola]|uniref:hypothetical protein n=1 Tax=Microvirga roseola TaxID=2883126 RepID=UPI001E4288A8|nr:hypothetical protein [Microvirga roseola]